MNIGVSPLTNRIFAGKSRQLKGAPEGQREWVGPKTDVTDKVLMVAIQFMYNKAGEPGGGSEIALDGYGTLSFWREAENESDA